MTRQEDIVLERGCIAVRKRHDQKQLVEERVYLAYASTLLGIIDKRTGQELTQ